MQEPSMTATAGPDFTYQQAPMVPPPPPAADWYRRVWVLPVAAGLVGLMIGAAGAGGDSGPTSAQLAAAEDRADAAERETDVFRGQAATAKTQAANAQADAEAAVKADADKAAAALKSAQDKLTLDIKAHEAKVKSDTAALDAREAKVSTLETVAKANEFEGEGIYLIPSDIKPGTYKAGPASSGNCYYARLTGPGGEIIDNNNTSGPVVVTIRPSDGALEVSGCETFRKVG
jgi:hypothetical protein